MQITAIQDRILYTIEVPYGTRVTTGDRSAGYDLDLIDLPGDIHLTGWSILDKARKGEHGMRIVAEQALPVVTERSEGVTL